MDELDREIEAELEKVKKRLEELQSAKRVSQDAFAEAWKSLEETMKSPT